MRVKGLPRVLPNRPPNVRPCGQLYDAAALTAPLRFARNTIIVPIHFRTRTMLQEIRGFCAGAHL